MIDELQLAAQCCQTIYIEKVHMRNIAHQVLSSKTAYFRIAGHLVELIVPKTVNITSCLPTFADFEEFSPQDEERIVIELCTSPDLTDIDDKRLLSNTSTVWGDRFRFEEVDQTYITSIQNEQRDTVWTMYSQKNFQHSIIYVAEKELYISSILNLFIMVAYGQAILSYNTLLLHASVVMREGRGFAFLGKSGTGKSTHSRLWLRYIQGSQLLNDDNPAVRILDSNQIIIYGTPWSGKTSCYRNCGVELQGLVRLRQSSGNQWTRVQEKDALLAVLPSCTSIRWNRELFAKMIDILEIILENVPVGLLNCLPDQAAADLCYQELSENKMIENE